MTSGCDSGVEDAIEKFSPRSNTSTKALLSRVARTSACGSVVQEDCGVPDTCGSCGDSKYRTPDNSEVFEGAHRETTRSVLMLPVSGRRPSAQEAEEIIQYERVDLEHVEEWTQAAFPAYATRGATSKKQAAQRETAMAEDMSEKKQVCS